MRHTENSRRAGTIPSIAIITSIVNVLMTLSKRQRLSDWTNKKDPTTCYEPEKHFIFWQHWGFNSGLHAC
jgi:hypothetical protein